MNNVCDINIIYYIDKIVTSHIMNNMNMTNYDIINNINSMTHNKNGINITNIMYNNDDIKNIQNIKNI